MTGAWMPEVRWAAQRWVAVAPDLSTAAVDLLGATLVNTTLAISRHQLETVKTLSSSLNPRVIDSKEGFNRVKQFALTKHFFFSFLPISPNTSIVIIGQICHHFSHKLGS